LELQSVKGRTTDIVISGTIVRLVLQNWRKSGWRQKVDCAGNEFA